MRISLHSRFCYSTFCRAPSSRARARRPLRPTKPLLLLVPVALCNPLASTATTTYLNSSYPRTSTAAGASLWTAPLQLALDRPYQRRLALAAIRTPQRRGRLLHVLAKLSPVMQAMCIGVRGSAAASRPGLRPLSTTTQSSIFLPTEVVELPPALGRLLKMALDCACRAAVPTPPTLPPPAPDAHRPTICERLKFERP